MIQFDNKKSVNQKNDLQNRRIQPLKTPKITEKTAKYERPISYKYQEQKKISRTYVFETTMQYERFKYYFVEACINFLLEYIERKEAVQ